MNLQDEIERRKQQLERLAEAKKVLEARDKRPKPPTPGPRDKDQYNFTDPESRIINHEEC